MKCIRFKLPSGAAGMAAGFSRARILAKVKALHVSFKHKTEGYALYVWFENEADYTYFFLTWDVENSWHEPTITEKEYIDDGKEW